MSDPIDALYRKVNRLPAQIIAAERRLLHLYREAERYKMADVLESTCYVNEAWDREVMLAYLAQQEAQRAA